MPIEQLTIQSVPKAWGQEEVVVNIPDEYSPYASDTVCGKAGYCGKMLHLRAGWQSSLHRHRYKDETFFVVRGRVRFEWEDSEGVMQEVVLDGEFRPAIRILPGTFHRFSAVTEDPIQAGIVASIVEFSTPHSDSDVERREQTTPLKRSVGFDHPKTP